MSIDKISFIIVVFLMPVYVKYLFMTPDSESAQKDKEFVLMSIIFIVWALTAISVIATRR